MLKKEVGIRTGGENPQRFSMDERFSLFSEEAAMNAMDRPLFLLRVVPLIIVLAVGIWFMLTGLQHLISAPSTFDGIQLLMLVTGFVCFFGGIAACVIAMSPSRK